MVGMNVIDVWKLDKIEKNTSQIIKECADIFSRTLIDATMREAISIDSLETSIEMNYNTICMSRQIDNNGTLISLLSQEVNPGSIHTKEYMNKQKQVRCIWCIRVNLIERKTTMKCIECNRGFFRKRDCWSHYVAYRGVRNQP